MAITVTIAPLTPSGVIGDSVAFTATPDGNTEGTMSYVWTVDGDTQTSVTDKMDYVITGPAGSKIVKVVATFTPTTGEAETAEAQTTLTAQNKTMDSASVVLTPASVTIEEGKSATFKASVTGAPSGYSVVYSWKKDGSAVPGNTDTYTIDTSVEGSQSIEVTAVISLADYDDKTVTATGKVTITPPVAPEPEGDLPYVHPLPHRSSAYIWAGWWVMDEIQKMTIDGKDWKIDDPDSKYYLHRYTLAKMIKDYPEVDVQESRNGYIIHKTALDAGIIYS